MRRERDPVRALEGAASSAGLAWRTLALAVGLGAAGAMGAALYAHLEKKAERGLLSPGHLARPGQLVLTPLAALRNEKGAPVELVSQTVSSDALAFVRVLEATATTPLSRLRGTIEGLELQGVFVPLSEPVGPVTLDRASVKEIA